MFKDSITTVSSFSIVLVNLAENVLIGTLYCLLNKQSFKKQIFLNSG